MEEIRCNVECVLLVLIRSTGHSMNFPGVILRFKVYGICLMEDDRKSNFRFSFHY